MPALSAVSKDVSAFSVSKKLLPKSAVGVDQLLDTEKNNKLKVVYSNKTTHLYLHVLGVILVISYFSHISKGFKPCIFKQQLLGVFWVERVVYFAKSFTGKLVGGFNPLEKY